MRLTFKMWYGSSVIHKDVKVTYVRFIGGKLIYQSATNYVVEHIALCRVDDVEVKP